MTPWAPAHCWASFEERSRAQTCLGTLRKERERSGVVCGVSGHWIRTPRKTLTLSSTNVPRTRARATIGIRRTG